jgi:O-antigen ligase
MILVVGMLLITLIIAQVVSRTHPMVALAGAIGIAVFIASFASVDVALYLLIFSMLLSPELGARDTGGGGVTIRLDDLFLSFVCFSWLARMALYKELGLFSKTKLNRPMFFYLGICFIATGLGAITGRVEPLKGFFFVLKFFQYFIIYFMLVNRLHDRKQINRFVAALIITCLIVSLTAMAQIPQGQRVSAPFEGGGGEPNTLGGYLALMMCLMLGLLFTQNALPSAKYKILLIFVVLLAFIIILFTYSRGTWITIVPIYLCFLFLSDNKRLLVILGISILVLVPILIPKSAIERLGYTFKVGSSIYERSLQESVGGITLDTSTSARVKSVKNVFRNFKNHPLLGYGVTGWKFLDNQYMKVLIETGLVGLTAFLGLLIVLIREAWRIYHNLHDKYFKGIALGFFVGILAMMIHSISTNTFIIVRIMEPFWFLAGMVMMLPVIEKQEQEERNVSAAVSLEEAIPVE